MVDLGPVYWPQKPVLVVGFHGYMGSGKDTAAKLFAEQYADVASHVGKQNIKIQTTAFAEPLKKAAKELFGGDEFFGTQADKAKEAKFWKNNLGPQWGTYRGILQHLGTEVIRTHVHRDFWVLNMRRRIVEAESDKEGGADVILITDVRFPNEAKMIHEHGGIVVNVVYTENKYTPMKFNPPWWKFWKKPSLHPSEVPLPQELIDRKIETSTISQLEEQIYLLARDVTMGKFTPEAKALEKQRY